MTKKLIKSIISRIKLPKGFWLSFTVYTIGFILIITALWGAQRQLFPENEELATLRHSVLINPFSSTAYIDLGTYYFIHNQPQLAKSVFSFAAQLDPDYAKQRYTLLVKNHTTLQQEAAFWENQLTIVDYRDGRLKLAQIYSQLGDEEKTAEQLQLARKIDPNYPALKG